MAHYKALHILQHDGAVPENAFVNTFHFVSAAANGNTAEANEIVLALQNFFDAFGTTGQSVMNMLSVNVAPGNRRIKVYDMGTPMPREPLVEAVTTAGSEGTGGFPSEVALVLSFHSTALPGVPLRRRRGRVYIGPLSDQSTYVSRTDGDVRPSALARQILTDAAVRLATTAVTDLTTWATSSTVDGVELPVEGGFVDNAYDTQRRRGLKATTRTNFVRPP